MTTTTTTPSPVNTGAGADADLEQIRAIFEREYGPLPAGAEDAVAAELEAESSRVRRQRKPRRVAHRLPRLAVPAQRAQRPVELLAACLWWLDIHKPRGRSANTPYVLAATVIAGDWRSGRGCRPGHDEVAQLVGCHLSTVWRQLEALNAAGLTVKVAAGGRVSHNGLVNDGATCVCQMHPAEIRELINQAKARGEVPHLCQWRTRREELVPWPAGIAVDDIPAAYFTRAHAIFADVAAEAPHRSGLPDPKVAPPDPHDPTGGGPGGEVVDVCDAGDDPYAYADIDCWAGLVDPDTGEAAALSVHDPRPADDATEPDCRMSTHAIHSPVGDLAGFSASSNRSSLSAHARKGDEGDISKARYPLGRGRAWGARRGSRLSSHNPQRWAGVPAAARRLVQDLRGRARQPDNPFPFLRKARPRMLARALAEEAELNMPAWHVLDLAVAGVEARRERQGFHDPLANPSSPEWYLRSLLDIEWVTDTERPELAEIRAAEAEKRAATARAKAERAAAAAQERAEMQREADAYARAGRAETNRRLGRPEPATATAAVAPPPAADAPATPAAAPATASVRQQHRAAMRAEIARRGFGRTHRNRVRALPNQ